MIFGENSVDRLLRDAMDYHLGKISEEFVKIDDERYKKMEFMSYTGSIHEAFITKYREFIEILKARRPDAGTLVVILSTPGGSPIAVEKMVEIMRYHYDEIYFVVPDSAMSAGTIWCMSGDKIFMDYASSLGPIDPQVLKDDRYVPALGYLDKIEEFIEKSKRGDLSPAEFAMMQQLDLAELRAYEQARDLSIDLLKKWLVKYKFKNWDRHRTTPELVGKEVTHPEKVQRAEEIARKLSDNSKWMAHGRYISMETLKNELKLEIEDYSDRGELRAHLIGYYELVSNYARGNNRPVYLHGRIE